MSKEDFSFREKKGPYDWELCPFGGSGRIILQEDEDGDLMGKCELAERALIRERAKNSLSRFFTGFTPEEVMKEDGCPYPPKWKRRKWRLRCKYNTGEYESL